MSWKKMISVVCAGAIGLMVLPDLAQAQRGRGRRTVVRPVIVAPYYSPYYNPFFWDFHGWGYPGPYLGHSYGRGYIGGSAARIQVTPRHTEVYVDGYHAGIVDDFDGFAQRLRVAPGGHVIELYLEGHRSISETVLFQPGQTYRIRHTMEPLAPGESAPARPTPQGSAPPSPVMYDTFGRPHAGPAGLEPSAAQGASVLAIRLQPGDATVLIDGEPWQGSGGDRLEIQVSPGPHRVEVRKDGYLPFTTTVDAKRGETTAVNISLTRQER